MAIDLSTLGQSRGFALLGWVIVHSLWQGAVIGVVVAAGLAAMRRAPASMRYAAALGAFLALPALCGITALRALGVPLGPAWSLDLPEALIALSPFAPWVAAAWVCGVVAASLRFAGGWLRMSRLQTLGKQADDRWQQVVAVLSQRLEIRRAVRVIETATADVPGVIGWISPVILFPVGALSGLTPHQVEMILTHELAHIRRNDYLVNVLQTLIETLFFYHPVSWWLSRRVRIEREHCCDDIVVKEFSDRLQYATALTDVERLRDRASAALAVAANGGDLLSRVQRMIEAPAQASCRVPCWVVGLLIFAPIIGVGALVAAPAAPLVEHLAAPSTLWISAALGLMLGMRHALEPDHLAAVSTLVAEERSARSAARLGASWGLGHTATLVAAGTGLTVVRVQMPPRVAGGFEVAVAIMLIGLGVRALRTAWQIGSAGPDTTHTHGALVHRHRGSVDHLHLGGWVVARRPLMVGMVHGLAGSGSLAALVMASLSSVSSQVAYIVVFGLGSTIGMTMLSGFAGWPLARLTRRPATLAWLSAVAGGVSIVLGTVWVGPLLWGML